MAETAAHPLFSDRRIKWLLIALVWTLVGLFLASQMHFQGSYSPRPVTWKRALSWHMTQAYIWLLLTPLMLLIARRVSLDRLSWWKATPVHFVVGLLFSLIHITLTTQMTPFISWTYLAAPPTRI